MSQDHSVSNAFSSLVRRYGFVQMFGLQFCKIALKILKRLGFVSSQVAYPVFLRGIQHPFFCRFETSDEWLLKHIFFEQEYGALGPVEQPKLILDCGANVGYSAIYFLNQYPDAQLIAVEPDPENLALCQRNLAPYGDRVRIVPSAIWSHATGLVLEQPETSRGEWGISVRPALAGERPDLQATDIGTLFLQSGCDRIDILKVDIETAEAVVFAEHYRPWLDHVRYLAIEIHQVPGNVCAIAVQAALSHYNCESWVDGELTFVKFLQPEARSQPLAA
jgi:FkbM family methyltransferase